MDLIYNIGNYTIFLLPSHELFSKKHSLLDKILDNTFEKYIIESIMFMEEHRGDEDTPGFISHEIEMMTRLLNWFRTIENEQQLKINRTDFVKYVDEYDKRRSTNFLETFPEYTDFYNRCKALC